MEIKRKGLISVEDTILKEKELDTVVEAARFEDWKVNGQARYEWPAEEAKACMNATKKVPDNISKQEWEDRVQEGFTKRSKFGHSVTKSTPSTTVVEVPDGGGTTVAVYGMRFCNATLTSGEVRDRRGQEGRRSVRMYGRMKRRYRRSKEKPSAERRPPSKTGLLAHVVSTRSFWDVE